MAQAIQIARDPFARSTLMRELVPKVERNPCVWCGQPAKFIYRWESDSVHVRFYTGYSKQFCSRGCFDIYYG
jgi:hypothetical protein